MSAKESVLNKIILHVGTHKIGTTSFQRSMEVNAAALISQGVRPIFGPVFKNNRSTPKKRANHIQFAHLLLRPEVLTGPRYRRAVPMLSDKERYQELERLSQEVASYEEETVLISCEVLCFLRTAEERLMLQRFLENIGREVTTLIAFRSNIEWHESWINQLKKYHNGLFFEKVSSENLDVSIIGPWYFDKSAIRIFWNEFNLTEIDYNSHLNIVQGLYDEILITSETIKTDFFMNRRN